MTTTLVVWTVNSLTNEESIAILNKAAEMKAQGKTDDSPVREVVDEQESVTRTWNTPADAEEWIVFVEQFNPISATIIN